MNESKQNKTQVNEQLQRFDVLANKFSKSTLMSKKNEVFRFLLETAGSADEIDLGAGANQDNITKALMSSMVQGN
jgi:hypothetical protein